MPILLEDLNLRTAERTLCETALEKAGSIVEAAQLLGITRHALKRRMIKHHIEWPAGPPVRPEARNATAQQAPLPAEPSSNPFGLRADG